MSLAILRSRALAGMSAPEVVVEVHLSGGLPQFSIVGLADTEVQESRSRVRAAILNARPGVRGMIKKCAGNFTTLDPCSFLRA